METKVFELWIKVFLTKDIPQSAVQNAETDFIDSALAKDVFFLKLHNQNQYKGYCLDHLYRIEKDGLYKSGRIYTFRVRTVDVRLAKYFSEVLQHHYTDQMKGLTLEMRILPKKLIGEVYNLTAAVVKTEQGYWRNSMTLSEYEEALFANIVKKYKYFTKQDVKENFPLYTSITFLNRTPIVSEYKGIKLLGDKLNLKIADNPMAQELAYFMLGAGLCSNNSRGNGFCNYRWI